MTKPPLNNITRLARAGALEQAWALFEVGGYMSGSDDPDVLAVHGRLLKDRAARERGAAREELLSDAIEAYERASTLSRATYPLINAATLAFLVGRRDHARNLAVQTLELLDSNDCAPETPYWLEATRAEALLLLGRAGEADSVLGNAIRLQPEAWEDHASTLRQFSLIAREMASPDIWLDRYRPPPSLHFEGIMGLAADDTRALLQIEERIGAIAPGNAFGALAAGADILVAEAAIRHGAHLHVILPCPPELFCDASVRPFGRAWETRFAGLMDEASSVLTLDDWQTLDEASVTIAREAAMGLAIRESGRLQSFACALSICGVGENRTQAGVDCWRSLDLPLYQIWAERSSNVRTALPATGRPVALLSLPEAMIRALPAAALPAPLAQRSSKSIYGFASLEEATLLAQGIAALHPEAALAIDYRAIIDDDERGQPWDRVLTIGSTSLGGAIALSESAALALALHSPSANVQPMGHIRAPAGDLPTYGLFPDARSGDQLGK